MPLWFWISLLVPAVLAATAMAVASLSSAKADRELGDDETTHARSLRPKPPGVAG